MTHFLSEGKKFFQKINTLTGEKFLFIVLVFIWLYGAFLRVQALPNASLWMDEGYSYLASKSLLETGSITLESGFVYGIHHIVFHVFQAFSLFLFGENEWGMRFPSLFFGICTYVFIFFFTRKIFTEQFFFSFVISIFLTLSDWQIAWSIQGRMYAVLQFFFIFSFFFYWSFLNASLFHKKALYFSLSIFFAIVSSYVHTFGMILFPIFLLSFLFFKRRTLNNPFLSIFLLLLVILFVYSEWLLFLWLYKSAGNNIFFYLRYYFDFHFFLLILSFFTFFLAIFRFRSYVPFLFFIFVSIVCPFLIISFFIDHSIAYRYTFPIFPLLLSLSFLWILFLKDVINRKKIFLSFFGILSVFAFFQEITLLPRDNYFLESDLPHYENYRSYTPQPNFRDAFYFVSENKNVNDVFITSHPEISRFYGLEADYVVPFDWEKRIPWKNLNRPEYLRIPHFYSLLEFHNVLQNYSGYLLLDQYSFDKIPEDVYWYIETNLEEVLEYPGKENTTYDSRIYLFHF